MMAANARLGNGAGMGRLVAVLGGVLLGTFMFQTSASAQQAYSITGVYTQKCCNWPNNPGLASFFPNPINSFPFAAGGGGLTIQAGQTLAVRNWTATGYPGGTLKLPAGAIRIQGSFLNTAPVFPGWISIFTAVDIDNEPGTFVPDGRTGTAAYCVGYAGNPNCADAAVGAFAFPGDPSAQPFNGRMSFSEKGGGDGRFGGTMRLIGGTPGFVFRTAGAGPGTNRYGQFAAPVNQIGGPFSEYQVESNVVVFTQNGVTTKTEYDPLLFAGIPWGTGNVYAVMSDETNPYIPTQSFSGAGYDARTAGGLGNIQLVSASFVRGPTTDGFPTLQALTLTVPEPGQLAMLIPMLALLALLGLRTRRGRSHDQA